MLGFFSYSLTVKIKISNLANMCKVYIAVLQKTRIKIVIEF